MPTIKISLIADSIAKTIIHAIRKLFEHDDATRAASVQLWVVMTTLLLVFNFLLDFAGPWYSNRLLVPSVQIMEMLSTSMVTYTLGLMQLSATRVNDFFQVWGVLMVTLQYSVMVGRPYARSSKRIPLLDLMSSFWAANLLRVQTVMLLKIPLWFIWAANAGRIIGYFLFSDKSITCNEENMRVVCDYMRYEHTLSKTTCASSSDGAMRGYKYLVFGEDEMKMKRTPGNEFRLELDVEHRSIVTVENIWELRDDSRSLLGGGGDPDDRLKDVCLSFSLYKLLRRRFFDLPIHEARLDKTRRLVFDALLQEKNDYERAFRITEVELSFLKGFFHNRHAQMFANGFPFGTLVLSLLLIAATGYIAYPVQHIRMNQGDRNVINHGVGVTRFIVGLFILKELSEIAMYVFSQWTKVQLICMHIKHPRFGRCWLVEKATRCMFRLINKGRWKQRISQYNIFISSLEVNLHATKLLPTSIKLEAEVKKAIFQCFKGLDMNPGRLGDYLSNAFLGSTKDGTLEEELKWAVDLEADTHGILVWHIATCLCEINLSAADDGTTASSSSAAFKTFWLRPRPFVSRSTARPEGVWEHHQVATSLSNYCAYLLTKRLVPDSGLVVKNVFEEVLWEKKLATYKCKSLQDIYDMLMEQAEIKPKEDEVTAGENSAEIKLEVKTNKEVVEEDEVAEGKDAIVSSGESEDDEPEEEEEDTLIMMGAGLGKQLITAYGEDRVQLWEVLAKFWAGFLLHLAANTRASKYKAHLAGDGELITHLWVLMSHAGFLGSTSHSQMMLDQMDLASYNDLNTATAALQNINPAYASSVAEPGNLN
ncbi:hypothetical protein E2562_004912 [Oryza meyeriana var. granulata]|uniref:DUF4220 domain-containing protein n=1 Tax=Oryza meyeriana var. granulata TaxID=110450 RepID=A0A6G1C421_9ORYZ|nr:hypothetical protein E2562_004912 [Oryza meyeriana var. granulata]